MSLVISSSTHMLFLSVLFNLHTFRVFQLSFCQWFLLLTEDIVWFCSFLFCFMVQNVVCFGKRSVWSGEESALVGRSILQMSVVCGWSMVLLISPSPYWFSACRIYPFARKRFWSLQLWQRVHLFLLAVLSVFVSSTLTLLLGAYILRIVMSSWRTDPFLIMWWRSLSLIIFFALKSALSEINIAIPFFKKFSVSIIFLYPFTFNLSVSLSLKWISCRQRMGESFFYPQWQFLS